MNPENIPKLINSIGLAFDIIGAWLVAIEVVRQFKDKPQFEDQPVITMGAVGFTPSPEKTEEYKKYETAKYRLMWPGLGCLTIGFLLQISSNWIHFPESAKKPEVTNTAQEINKPTKLTITQENSSKAPVKETIKPKTKNPVPDK